jgi:hypothetical protein
MSLKEKLKIEMRPIMIALIFIFIFAPLYNIFQ